MNKRKMGGIYEAKAAEYLQKKGFILLEQNYRNRSGEIDIIARDNEYLCFIEVKYRATSGYGSPLEAVDTKKQMQIRKVALYYLMKQGFKDDVPCRFDVIAFEGDELTHLENAF